MKDSYWKAATLLLMAVLIVVTASLATSGQSRKSSKSSDDDKKMPEYAEDGVKSVVVEGNKDRYRLSIGGGSRGTENEKIFLYDSWDLVNTKDIWFLADCHTSHPMWKRVPFDRK